LLPPNFSGREIFSSLYIGNIRIFVMSSIGFGSPSGQYAFDILFLISLEESATEISPPLSDDDILPDSVPFSEGINDVWTNVGTG